jgi:hypothetical protein
METILLRKTEFPEDASTPRSEHSEQLFVRSKAVVSRRVAGETLIVPVRGKVGDLASIYSFNGSGSLIWERLQSPTGFAELVAAVEQEYEVAPEQAHRDVTQFLNDMLSVGLVEVRAGAAMHAIETNTQQAQGELQASS